MTHIAQISRRNPARPDAIFSADDAFRSWLRASLRARFLQKLIGLEPAVAQTPRKKSAVDAVESWTVCLDSGANLPLRRLSILSERGAAPAMRIESIRAEKIFAGRAQPEIG